MKTIKQLADEIGVSKTAIRKRLIPELKSKFAETVCGVIYISSEGENYIKSTFSVKIPESKFAGVSGNQFAHVSSEISTFILILKEELDTKNKEIDMKNEQIRELNARLAESNIALITAQQSAQAAQALHAGTIHKQIVDVAVPSSSRSEQVEEPSCKTFLQRIFGGKLGSFKNNKQIYEHVTQKKHN